MIKDFPREIYLFLFLKCFKLYCAGVSSVPASLAGWVLTVPRGTFLNTIRPSEEPDST
jgi:hypothetical protein